MRKRCMAAMVVAMAASSIAPTSQTRFELRLWNGVWRLQSCFLPLFTHPRESGAFSEVRINTLRENFPHLPTQTPLIPVSLPQRPGGLPLLTSQSALRLFITTTR
jgi:hypothetical protein